jgi:hypothetical protein
VALGAAGSGVALGAAGSGVALGAAGSGVALGAAGSGVALGAAGSGVALSGRSARRSSATSDGGLMSETGTLHRQHITSRPTQPMASLPTGCCRVNQPIRC